MPALSILREGIGDGALAVTTQGFILPAIAPIIVFSFRVIPSSGLLIVIPEPAAYRVIPSPALLLVDGQPALLRLLGADADAAIAPGLAIFEIIPEDLCSH
jgi:hypothetical protein